MNTINKHWIAGLALAAAGIVTARVISPRFDTDPVIQMVIFIIGVTLALAGMVVIMMGMRKHTKKQ